MRTVPPSSPNAVESSHLSQPKWQRVTLLSILGYEAAGCLLGGTLLVVAPDGRLMDMPVGIMHGTFKNFLIPGIILFALGIINTAAFLTVLRRRSSGWFWACMAMGSLAVWFWIEIAILLELHWLHIMWGGPVVIGCILAPGLIPGRQEFFRKAALLCGIISSVLYAVVNVVVAMQWEGYSMASQTPSELSAIGAPTRMLWQVLCTPYTLLVIAFAWGVWKSAGSNRYLRIAGASLLAYGALGILWPFAPMHLREPLAAGGGTISDTLHLALAAATELFYMVALGFAAAALGKMFRIYSIITFIALVFFGVLTFMEAPGISTNQPTPHIGIWERINIGVFLIWMIVLATILLQKKQPPAPPKPNTRSAIKAHKTSSAYLRPH